MVGQPLYRLFFNPMMNCTLQYYECKLLHIVLPVLDNLAVQKRMTYPSHATSEHYHTAPPHIVQFIAQPAYNTQTACILRCSRTSEKLMTRHIPPEGDANDN